MNDSIEFSFPVDLIDHVRSLFSSASSALSVFSEYPGQAVPGASADTEALRKAGILDALGHLSPAFQKTLVFLACPEARTSVSIEEILGRQKFSIYHAAGLSRSVLVNFSGNQLNITDPAHLELVTQEFAKCIGNGRTIPVPFDTELPIGQALIFSSLLDLQRKSEVNKIMGEPSHNSFSMDEVQNHLINSIDSSQWLTAGIKQQLSTPFQIDSLELELSQLIKEGLCISENGNYSLKSHGLQIAQNLLIATRKITISLSRIFRGAQLSEMNYIFLQGCYGLFLGYSVFNEKSVRFTCYNNPQFLEKGAYWFYKGIFELPEPAPSESFAQDTLIVSAPPTTTWKLFPKSSPQGTRTTSALAPITLIGSIRFGRSPDNQIVLSDPSVSRLHAQIELKDGFCWIADLNSSNGTFVNGSKIKNSIKLSHADLIQIGPFSYEIISEESIPSESGKKPAQLQPLITATEPEIAIGHSDKPLLCPRCGQPVTQSMHYCDQCGQSLEG